MKLKLCSFSLNEKEVSGEVHLMGGEGTFHRGPLTHEDRLQTSQGKVYWVPGQRAGR